VGFGLGICPPGCTPGYGMGLHEFIFHSPGQIEEKMTAENPDFPGKKAPSNLG